MTKISRNQSCPCRSGKKYKHCCLPFQQAGLQSPVTRHKQKQISLHGEIDKIQQAARHAQEQCREQGVFIFFSTTEGDAWVLETTEGDALQVAAQGLPLPLPIEENHEVIEVDWSHAFTLRNHQLFLLNHTDKTETELLHAPTQQISAALRRIKKQYSADLLRQVHVRAVPAPPLYPAY
jgi:hypothetical protein